jgi:hypothetical protein
MEIFVFYYRDFHALRYLSIFRKSVKEIYDKKGSLHEDLCKVKVKCTLVRALRLCTGPTAHRGSRGIAVPFLDHGTRRG